MKISEIDKNFAKEEMIDGGYDRYAIPHPSFTLKGVFYEEEAACFARMPSAVAEKVSDGVLTLSKHTAGGRLCFATDSSGLKIEVAYKDLWIMSHMPLTGSSGFSLFESTEEGENFICNLMPISTDKQGFIAEAKLKGGKMRKYILYFPLYNDVKSLAISLNKGATVYPINPYRDKKPILYYGSSITQGGCASRPDTCYQALICKKNRIDFINLGFSGSAKGEEDMVDYLASIDCSIFVCDYDHNAPTAEYLQNTHFRLYKRYREKRPKTPILFITKPDLRKDAEGDLRYRIIKNTYHKAKKLGDSLVYFLSGKTFYGKNAPAEYAVDGTHPTDYGFRRMAEVIYKKLIRIDEENK